MTTDETKQALKDLSDRIISRLPHKRGKEVVVALQSAIRIIDGLTELNRTLVAQIASQTQLIKKLRES